MNGGDEEDRRFLDALSNDLASEVLEDETACAEALSLGPDANAVIARIQQAAGRAVAEQRRARIARLGQHRSEPMPSGRYGKLSRAEVLKLLEERQYAVEHRELTDVTDDDLRTLLEDLDAVRDQNGNEE